MKKKTKRKLIIVEERMTHCPYCDNILLLRINAIKPSKEFMALRRKLAGKVEKALDLD